MYLYQSEVLKVGVKVFTNKATDSDLTMLDELINKRAQEGWELVTYDYMATSTQIQGAFIVTFRKEK